MKFYTYYNPPPKKSVSFADSPSKTESWHMDECNLKLLVDRVMKGAVDASTVFRKAAAFSDATSVSNFVEASLIVAQGKSMFEKLPAKVRDEFGNSPENLLRFLDDPANRKKATEMGFFEKTTAPDTGGRTDESLDITGTTDTKVESKAKNAVSQ